MIPPSVLLTWVHLYPVIPCNLESCFLCQDPPAPGPPAVSGTMLRGHSLSAGHGVLPSGRTQQFIQSLPNYPHSPLFPFFHVGVCVILRRTFPVSSQGDLKSYLHSCRVADSETPNPLLLQRMACDIASGLLHLHKYDFTHRYSVSIASALFTFITVNVQERKNPSMCFVLPLLVSPHNNILVLPE